MEAKRQPEISSEFTVKVHKIMSEVYDVNVILVFNPLVESNAAASQLPLSAYEGIFKDSDLLFNPLRIRTETDEAERIGLDEIVSNSHGSGSGQEVSKRISTQLNAFGMFRQKLIIVREYVAKVKRGEIDRDEKLMRQINAFTRKLQAMEKLDPDVVAAHEAQDVVVFTEALVALIQIGDGICADIGCKLRIKRDGDMAVDTSF